MTKEERTKARKAAYYQAHKAKAAAYYQAHKEEIAARNAAIALERAEYGAAYYAATKPHRAAYAAAYYAAHREERAAAGAAWRAANSGTRAACRTAYKVAKAQRVPPWFTPESCHAIYHLRDSLQAATGVPHHVDHEVPLRGRLVSGLHVSENLRVSTAVENLSKNAKFDPMTYEWWPPCCPKPPQPATLDARQID